MDQLIRAELLHRPATALALTLLSASLSAASALALASSPLRCISTTCREHAPQLGNHIE